MANAALYTSQHVIYAVYVVSPSKQHRQLLSQWSRSKISSTKLLERKKHLFYFLKLNLEEYPVLAIFINFRFQNFWQSTNASSKTLLHLISKVSSNTSHEKSIRLNSTGFPLNGGILKFTFTILSKFQEIIKYNCSIVIGYRDLTVKLGRSQSENYFGIYYSFYKNRSPVSLPGQRKLLSSGT